MTPGLLRYSQDKQAALRKAACLFRYFVGRDSRRRGSLRVCRHATVRYEIHRHFRSGSSKRRRRPKSGRHRLHWLRGATPVRVWSDRVKQHLHCLAVLLHCEPLGCHHAWGPTRQSLLSRHVLLACRWQRIGRIQMMVTRHLSPTISQSKP